MSLQTTTAQYVFESGQYPLKNYAYKEYNGLPQNWAIAQDKRGVLYFANNDGLLEFDGINWRKYTFKKGNRILSIHINDTSPIYIGGIDEFGYMSPNKNGSLHFQSLTHLLDSSITEIGNVWYIHQTKHGIFFHTNNHLFLYKNGNMRDFGRYHTSFYVNDKFYVKDKTGMLSVFENDSLRKIKGTEILGSVYAVLKLNHEKLLVATDVNGLFTLPMNSYDVSSTIKPFMTEADQYLKNNQIYSGIALSDSTYSFGTNKGGIVIITNKGKLKQIINKNSGISSETIKAQFLDQHNQLWLGMGNGISVIDINSPISFFDEKNGLQGTVRSLAKYNENVYAITNVGLFCLENHNTSKFLKNRALPEKLFIPTSIKEECWAAEEFNLNDKKMLLVVGNNDVFQVVSKNKYKKIFSNGTPYSIVQSKINPERLFIGLYNGLTSIRLEGDQWIEEARFDNLDYTIEDIREDAEGNLWLGTFNDGVIKVSINYLKDKIHAYEATVYNRGSGFIEGPYFPRNVADTILFRTGSGVYQHNVEQDSMVPQSILGKNFTIANRYVHRLKEDKNGNIWFATYISENERDEVGMAQKTEDGYEYDHIPFNTISEKGIIYAIYHEDNNITWIGGPEGIYKFNGNIVKDYNKKYYPTIRRVILENDSVLFHGTYYNEKGNIAIEQPQELKKILDYRYNSVTFEFAAQNTNPEFPLEFSFFLKGNDKDWSDWSDKHYKDYTNLAEGDYIFMVKARDIYENESQIATYEFSVLPPWYRTVWAYIGYVILLAIFVYTVVTLYTRNLREIIKRKTAEIREQKDEIEAKNEHIMDSIKYAQRIQSALLPGDKLRANLSEHFVLFKPRDIVSGDFYWMSHLDSKSILVAADCTGHGVPGAFMSMLGMSFLNEVVNKSQVIESDQILNKLRENVIASLKQTGKADEAKDGMDLALYVWDREMNTIEFSGANNPLVYTRPMTKEELDMVSKGDESFLEKGEIHDGKNLLKQLKADKMPIGIYAKKDVPFSKESLQADQGYTFYTFSDGFVDQFGGDKGKKFMTKRFKQLLLEIYHEPMEKQKEILDKAIKDWIGTKYEQVDDIIVLGLRI